MYSLFQENINANLTFAVNAILSLSINCLAWVFLECRGKHPSPSSTFFTDLHVVAITCNAKIPIILRDNYIAIGPKQPLAFGVFNLEKLNNKNQ